MKTLLTILTLIGASLFTGCAVLESIENNPQSSRIIVQQATLRFIDDDQERAAKVYEIASVAYTFLEQDDAVSVTQLRQHALDLIDWKMLPVADQLLLTSLLDALQDRIFESTGIGAISESERIQLSRVLSWIRMDAQLSLR